MLRLEDKMFPWLLVSAHTLLCRCCYSGLFFAVGFLSCMATPSLSAAAGWQFQQTLFSCLCIYINNTKRFQKCSTEGSRVQLLLWVYEHLVQRQGGLCLCYRGKGRVSECRLFKGAINHLQLHLWKTHEETKMLVKCYWKS